LTASAPRQSARATNESLEYPDRGTIGWGFYWLKHCSLEQRVTICLQEAAPFLAALAPWARENKHLAKVIDNYKEMCSPGIASLARVQTVDQWSDEELLSLRKLLCQCTQYSLAHILPSLSISVDSYQPWYKARVDQAA
jgi:hypothetical protein